MFLNYLLDCFKLILLSTITVNCQLFMKDNYTRLVLIVSLALIGLSVLFSLETYYSDIANSESASLLRLEGIAQAVALQIDGDDHLTLTEKYAKMDAITSNTQDSIYKALHLKLSQNLEATMLHAPIYTLVLDSVSKNIAKFSFIITSSDIPFFRHPYPTYPEILKTNYTKGGTIPMFHDMYGTWLAAFTPITNSQNKQVGIIMINERFDYFLIAAKKAALIHLLYGLLLSLPIVGLLIWWVRNVLRREAQLKNKIKQSLDENVAMNIALESSYDQLSKVETQRKEMIANISHDLRTPISSILGYVETVLMRRRAAMLGSLDGDKTAKLDHLDNHKAAKHGVSTDDTQFLTSALREGEKLKKLINDLFELSKLEAPQLKLNKERFSLAEILSDTFMSYEKKFEDAHITSRLDIAENKMFIVSADMQLINRLLQNLLDNAIRHNQVSDVRNQGSENEQLDSLQAKNSMLKAHGFITAKLSDYNGKARCTIENSSAELTSDNLDNIFNRYFTLATDTGGTGLGLSIVKKICDVHNADIQVTHKNGVTSFTFVL